MKVKQGVSLFVLIVLALLLYHFELSEKTTLAPDVVFTTISGKKIQLTALKGKPVVVVFWATDCATCIKEVPDLVELYQKFHQRGLEMIAVAMYYDLPNHVLEMTQAKKIPYDVALDLNARHATAFGHVELTPTTFLISPSGYIVMQKTGLLDIKKISSMIDQSLQG